MSATSNCDDVVTYRTALDFEQRLLVSVISGVPIRITDINVTDKEPGISEEQYSLIQLIVKVTKGTVFKLNKMGTDFYFQPGLVHGGDIKHDCCADRGIAYYLELLIMLCLFCKTPLKATLRGVTTHIFDFSVDHIKASLIPMLKQFVVDDEGIDLKIIKRGMAPNGGGEVIFTCPVKNKFKPIELLETGRVQRIRGTAYALHTSTAVASRLVNPAEEFLLNYFPDVQINVDRCTGRRAGKSPGYGIHLYAEMSNGLMYSSQGIALETMQRIESCSPENLGMSAAEALCYNICTGTYNDPTTQSLAVIYMALGQRDISKLIIRTLSRSARSLLRYLVNLFDVTFMLESTPHDGHPLDSDKTILSCVGTGYLYNCK